jgi:hypothetical protein
MTFNEQPSGIVGAKSTIIYQAYDSLYTSTNFYYEFKVFVWTGSTTIPASPVATIQRKPDQFGGGRAWIDVHKIVQQYLTDDYLINGTYKPNIEGGLVYVAVKVQGIYSTGTTSQITSNTVMATSGYSYTFDGLNKDITKTVFTDKDTFYIPFGTSSYYIWYNATTVTSIDINGTAITPNVGTTTNYKIQGVDLIQLITASGQTGDCVVDFNTASTTVSFNIVRECENRYGNVVTHFLNRYGVYESYCFNALSRKTNNTTKETYQQPIYKQSNLNTPYSYGVGITTQFNVNAISNLMVNTNWIPEAENTIINQLFWSDNILLLEDTKVKSVRVVDSSLQEKKRVNDKLIDYTINFEYSQPIINKIVR